MGSAIAPSESRPRRHGILDGSWGQWAVEIKTGAVRSFDLAPLLEFTRRYPAYRPLLIASAKELSIARRAGIDAMTWHEFLLRQE